MPQRLSRIIDVDATAGVIREVTANLPNDVSHVQISIDRLAFEDVHADKAMTVAWLQMWDAQSGLYLGGVQVPGGRFEDDVRPGSRGLWTWGRWRIPPGTQSIRFRCTPSEDFTARVDVDLFFTGELS